MQATNVATIAVGTVFRYLAYRSWVFPAYEQAPEPSETAGVALAESAAALTDR